VGKLYVAFRCSLLSFHCKSVTATKSLSIFSTTLSTNLTNLTALLPQSSDDTRYVSRPILAPPPLRLHKNSTRTNICAISRMVTWLWFLIVIYPWNWRICGITTASPNCRYTSGLSSAFHTAQSCSTNSSYVPFEYVNCFELLRVTWLS